jgi:hypothetical protein
MTSTAGNSAVAATDSQVKACKHRRQHHRVRQHHADRIHCKKHGNMQDELGRLKQSAHDPSSIVLWQMRARGIRAASHPEKTQYAPAVRSSSRCLAATGSG